MITTTCNRARSVREFKIITTHGLKEIQCRSRQSGVWASTSESPTSVSGEGRAGSRVCRPMRGASWICWLYWTWLKFHFGFARGGCSRESALTLEGVIFVGGVDDEREHAKECEVVFGRCRWRVVLKNSAEVFPIWFGSPALNCYQPR